MGGSIQYNWNETNKKEGGVSNHHTSDQSGALAGDTLTPQWPQWWKQESGEKVCLYLFQSHLNPCICMYICKCQRSTALKTSLTQPLMLLTLQQRCRSNEMCFLFFFCFFFYLYQRLPHTPHFNWVWSSAESTSLLAFFLPDLWKQFLR